MDNAALFRRISISMFGVATCFTVGGFYGAYLNATRLSIGLQVFSHIVLMLGPAIGKLGVVMRMAVNDALAHAHEYDRPKATSSSFF